MLTRLAPYAIVVMLALASPPTAAADRVYRVGLLGVATAAGYAPQAAAFRRGMAELGYVEGRNLVIEARWADDDMTRLRSLADELVRLAPDVIVTSGPGTAVAKRATSSIPIVMAAAGDPVASGLVASLARPGGNVTGSSFFLPEISAKRLEILRETLPRLDRVAVLYDPAGTASQQVLRAVQDAARSGSIQIQPVEARDRAQIARAFAAIAASGAGAVLVTDATVFVSEGAQIGALALEHRLPAIGSTECARSGCLLAYGADFPDLWHKAASFTDRILRGTKPADLPVQQAAKFDLVVNQKAARALGVTPPRSLLLRATETIE